MSGYRRVNYYELCRLCTSSEGNKMNIFREEGRRQQLQTKIQTYLPIQVLEEDSLPKIVCHECIRKLENYIEFRDTVVSAEGMLESYFTSLRFSEDFLKEGKVYVKSTEKERPPTPEDPLKIEKIVPANEPIIVNETSPQPQHQQPVVVNNLNTSNIQIIRGVQARVQQYKCAMQMQSGGVAAAVVEATAETHYSYQQQTSQVSPQNQQSRLNEPQQQQQQQPQSVTQQIQVQNQIATQNQINQIQNSRQVVTSNQQPQLSNRQTNTCQMAQIQQMHEFEKQRLHHQIDKQVVITQSQDPQQQQSQQQNQSQVIHQNNILVKTDIESQQVPLKSEVDSQSINSPGDNVQNYATVQATPEVFLSLGFKDAAALSATQSQSQQQQQQQQQRDETKDFRDYIKNATDDALTRNSIGQISEFLRIRSCPNDASPLITVNPQVICQTSRNNYVCRDCGKTFDNSNQLTSHQCPNSPMINDITDINGIKDTDTIQNNNNNSNNSNSNNNSSNNTNPFNCDICGKPFKRKEHLFQHRKLHTGERPYVCTTCAKAFSRKEHLVRHSVSHTGQKMHECEMCGKSFSRKDNLHKHRKTHGVSGPYICETCGKSFVVKHYYLMHLTSHAPTVIDGDNRPDPLPYKCDLCHKAFSVKQYLTTHKLRHRSKNNSTANNQNQTQSAQANLQSNANGINVTNSVSGGLTATNGHAGDTPVVEIHNVIERNDTANNQQQQQQVSQAQQFGNNAYHANVQQFQ